MSASNSTSKPQIRLKPSTTEPRMAKLFKNGRSQAVRLPKEFRFEGGEVAIRRNPATGEVVLSQIPVQETKSWQEWFDLLDSLDIPEGTFEREVHIPTEREIF